MRKKLEIWTEKKRSEKIYRKVDLSIFQKNVVLWIIQPGQVEQQVTPTIQILMLTYQNGVNQEVVKRNILERVRLGEEILLRIKRRNWKEAPSEKRYWNK